MANAREERARKRRNWPGGLTRTHEPAQRTTAAARLATMWQLALDAWAYRGEPLPEYDRAAMPGRLIRPGSAPHE